MVSLNSYLILSALLFSIGAIGVFTRRNALIIYMCIELMLNAVNLTFVAFSKYLGNMDGHVFVFMIMTVAAAEAAVGLACANAVLNAERPALLHGDILDHLDLRAGDDVGMVGHFGPLVGPIRKRVRSLTVFERTELASDDLRPQQEAVHRLPQCQVALITATSMINHTLGPLLQAARNCREVVLLGASTPLLAEAFRDDVTLLSGVVVSAPQEVLRVVSEGGGMRQFGPYVRKVTLRVSSRLSGAVRMPT